MILPAYPFDFIDDSLSMFSGYDDERTSPSNFADRMRHHLDSVAGHDQAVLPVVRMPALRRSDVGSSTTSAIARVLAHIPSYACLAASLLVSFVELWLSKACETYLTTSTMSSTSMPIAVIMNTIANVLTIIAIRWRCSSFNAVTKGSRRKVEYSPVLQRIALCRRRLPPVLLRTCPRSNS